MLLLLHCNSSKVRRTVNLVRAQYEVVEGLGHQEARDAGTFLWRLLCRYANHLGHLFTGIMERLLQVETCGERKRVARLRRSAAQDMGGDHSGNAMLGHLQRGLRQRTCFVFSGVRMTIACSPSSSHSSIKAFLNLSISCSSPWTSTCVQEQG